MFDTYAGALPQLDVFGIGAPLTAAGTVALGLLVWLGSLALRALVGGRWRASLVSTGCGCLLGLLGVASALVILALVALFVVGMLAAARGTASLPIAGLLA